MSRDMFQNSNQYHHKLTQASITTLILDQRSQLASSGAFSAVQNHCQGSNGVLYQRKRVVSGIGNPKRAVEQEKSLITANIAR